jgi:hypothetical protein
VAGQLLRYMADEQAPLLALSSALALPGGVLGNGERRAAGPAEQPVPAPQPVPARQPLPAERPQDPTHTGGNARKRPRAGLLHGSMGEAARLLACSACLNRAQLLTAAGAAAPKRIRAAPSGRRFASAALYAWLIRRRPSSARATPGVQPCLPHRCGGSAKLHTTSLGSTTGPHACQKCLQGSWCRTPIAWCRPDSLALAAVGSCPSM